MVLLLYTRLIQLLTYRRTKVPGLTSYGDGTERRYEDLKYSTVFSPRLLSKIIAETCHAI